MKGRFRNLLKVNAALSALIAGVPSIALAQEDGGGLQDIVVTARRVAENLQDVPISVGAVDQAALQARGISSLTEIKSAVANVTISKTGVAGGNYVFIRGIPGASIPNVAADGPIGLYLDGVYLGRPNSSGGDIADLERIEVLRGPQGTLSGRNAAGGAVNFITASPTGEFGVIAEGTVGNYARYRGRLTVNTPEVSGFAARITYVHDQNHGTIRNLAGGKTYNYGSGFGSFTAADRVDALNSDTVMAKVRYSGVDDLTVDYKFDFSDQQEVFPGTPTVGFPTTTLGAPAAGLVLAQPAGAVPLTWGRRPAYVNLDMLAPASIRTYGHALTAAYDINDSLTVKSITAYRNLKTRQQGEVDGMALNLPLCVACSVVKVKQDQISQELQLIGKVSDVKYILGGYFFRENGFDDTAFSAFKSLVPGADGTIPIGVADYAVAGSKEKARNTSYAVYGHLDYSILDNLELALGARYTMDERVSTDLRPSLAAPVRGEVDYKRFNYDVALTYSFTPDIHVYGRYATGYLSGGIMKSAVFRPEDHKAFEFGVKSELFDRRVRFNAAYFHTDVKDRQSPEVVLSGTGPQGLIIRNFADVEIDGVEAELTVAPVRGLTLGTNFGYHKLRSTGQDVPQTPRTTLSFNAQYDTPELENGIFLSFRIDGDYRSKYYGSGMLLESQRTATPGPGTSLPAPIWAGYPSQQAYLDDMIASNLAGGYWMFNARISANDIPLAGAKARVTGFVRNLTDVEGRNYFVNNGLYQTGYERPMTYGLELAFNF